MAEDKTTVEENLTGLDKLQKSYEANANVINIAVIAVLLVIVGVLAYVKIYKPQRELAAQEVIFKGQYYFEMDSFEMALNNGILEAADSYGGTKIGNLAKYYAGISYYKLGNYPMAEDYLNKFSPDADDVVGGLGLSTLADAQMENGNTADALKNYKKAAELSDNEAAAPILLFKAGLAYETNGKYNEAKGFYQEIKDKFPNSDQARNIDAYIGRVEAQL